MAAMTRLLSCFLALGLATGFSGCKGFDSINKKPKFTVSFHVQASEQESPRGIFHYQPPGQTAALPFKRVPDVTQENVAGFHAFPATNGNGYGVTLRLDFRGASALDLMTRTHPGELALALVNGTPVDYLAIDRPVSDGIITIWEGVPEPVLKLMQAKWPAINQLKSMSTGQEMVPTTKAEKRRSKEAADAQTKAANAAAKRNVADPQAPQLPSSPTTNQIPLEGNRQEQPLPPIKQ